MEEAASSSTWLSSLSSWFSPTSLFLLFNLVICIIFLSSSFSSSRKPKPQQQQQQQQQEQEHQQEQPPLTRAPSVLQRLKSINLYHFKPEDFNPFQTNTDHLNFPTSNSAVIVDTTASLPSSSETKDYQELEQTQTPSIFKRLKSIKLCNFKTEDFNPITTHNQKHGLDSSPIEKRQQSSNKNKDEFLNHRAMEKNNSRERLYPVVDESLNSLYLSKKNSKPRERMYPDIEEFKINKHLDDEILDQKNKSKMSLPPRPKKNQKSGSSKSDGIVHKLKKEEEEEMDNYENKRPSLTVEEINRSKGEGKMIIVDDDDEEVDSKADDFINRFKNQLKLQRLDSLMRYKNMLTGGSAKLS